MKLAEKSVTKGEKEMGFSVKNDVEVATLQEDRTRIISTRLRMRVTLK